MECMRYILRAKSYSPWYSAAIYCVGNGLGFRKIKHSGGKVVRNTHFGFLFACAMIVPLCLLIGGCGGGGGSGSGGIGMATVGLTSSITAGPKTLVYLKLGENESSPVPIEDVESLTVTVTEVVFQRCNGNDTDEDAADSAVVEVEADAFDPTSVTIEQGGTVHWVWEAAGLHTVTSGAATDLDAGSLFNESRDMAGEEVALIFDDTGAFPYFSDVAEDILAGMAGKVEVVEDEDGEDPVNDGGDPGSNGGGHVTVFRGSFDVDILQLGTLAEVLTSEEIPAGRYCKIRLRIQNPRLVLIADPLTERTNVRLTANGRLFIGTKFEIRANRERIIVIDFGGIHLIDAGNSGQLVLTPQLRADVNVTEIEVQVEGEILSIDCDGGTMTIVMNTDDAFEVLLDNETVFEDELENSISCGSLGGGDRVTVQ